jgi:hypothetical protein
VRPLADWLRDANSLTELEYCARHPYPLLVHATTGYKMRPVEKLAMTLDRVVLSPVTRPRSQPSAIDDYLALPVLAMDGRRTYELSVGCNEDCDIWLNDVTVSNLHAHMTQDRHGNWYVQDAGSSTGTHVNDRDPDPTQVLVAGDRISFGLVDLTFTLPAQAFQLVRRLV